MTTYIVPEHLMNDYRAFMLNEPFQNATSVEAQMHLALLGIQLEDLPLEEAKERAAVGDCILVKHSDGRFMPFQVVDKKRLPDGSLDVIVQTYFLTRPISYISIDNSYEHSELRKTINSKKFLDEFDQEFADALKLTEVRVGSNVMFDKCWIPSHEELGLECNEAISLQANDGTFTYDYYKQS